MRNLLLILLFFIVSCQKEYSPVNDLQGFRNTSGWRVEEYSVNGKRSGVFTNYIFEFYDNEKVGCPGNMDGKSPLGVFGGYYEIVTVNKKLCFNIIQANVFNLNQIIGVWEIVVINGNTIYLIRLNNKDRQDIIFSRN